MTFDRTKNLKPWAKGQSGNPRGSVGALPLEIRQERRNNQANFIKLITLYLSLSDEQAKQRISDPDSTQLEEIIQGLVGKAKEGDVPAAKYLVETMTGKIPESDHDEISEDDLKIFRRIKEVLAEQQAQIENEQSREGDSKSTQGT